ncbi:hypothetical protein K440DRAFT_670386 [Wilcoxina mikolae CBS 423.85]|nr:hypothetical protein K440DRAFT_670386 [Wilcoxina mikolae CBS 423.85]
MYEASVYYATIAINQVSLKWSKGINRPLVQHQVDALKARFSHEGILREEPANYVICAADDAQMMVIISALPEGYNNETSEELDLRQEELSFECLAGQHRFAARSANLRLSEKSNKYVLENGCHAFYECHTWPTGVSPLNHWPPDIYRLVRTSLADLRLAWVKNLVAGLGIVRPRSCSDLAGLAASEHWCPSELPDSEGSVWRMLQNNLSATIEECGSNTERYNKLLKRREAWIWEKFTKAVGGGVLKDDWNCRYREEVSRLLVFPGFLDSFKPIHVKKFPSHLSHFSGVTGGWDGIGQIAHKYARTLDNVCVHMCWWVCPGAMQEEQRNSAKATISELLEPVGKKGVEDVHRFLEEIQKIVLKYNDWGGKEVESPESIRLAKKEETKLIAVYRRRFMLQGWRAVLDAVRLEFTIRQDAVARLGAKTMPTSKPISEPIVEANKIAVGSLGEEVIKDIGKPAVKDFVGVIGELADIWQRKKTNMDVPNHQVTEFMKRLHSILRVEAPPSLEQSVVRAPTPKVRPEATDTPELICGVDGVTRPMIELEKVLEGVGRAARVCCSDFYYRKQRTKPKEKPSDVPLSSRRTSKPHQQHTKIKDKQSTATTEVLDDNLEEESDVSHSSRRTSKPQQQRMKTKDKKSTSTIEVLDDNVEEESDVSLSSRRTSKQQQQQRTDSAKNKGKQSAAVPSNPDVLDNNIEEESDVLLASHLIRKVQQQRAGTVNNKAKQMHAAEIRDSDEESDNLLTPKNKQQATSTASKGVKRPSSTPRTTLPSSSRKLTVVWGLVRGPGDWGTCLLG